MDQLKLIKVMDPTNLEAIKSLKKLEVKSFVLLKAL
jgi:hypothetical protein